MSPTVKKTETHLPPEIPDLPGQFDATKLSEASKKAVASLIAKGLVLLSFGGALLTRETEVVMLDPEALGFAYPATTMLFRYGWFQKIYKEYGHHLVNTEEIWMLGTAAYFYVSRVTDAIKQRKTNEQQGKANVSGSNGTQATAEPATDGRFAGPIPNITGFRGD